LEKLLCWHIEGLKHPRPSPYRAPTWSWASTDGEVRRTEFEGKTHAYIEVLEATTINSTGSQFGEVSGGNLKLSCEALLPCRRTNLESIELSTGESIPCYIEMDFKDELPKGDRAYYLLPVLRESVLTPSMGTPKDEIEVILLQPISGERGQYQRVGYLTTRMQPPALDTSAQTIEEGIASLQSIGGLSDAEYVQKVTDELGVSQYIINIV
jgi:hypothetical protein